MTDGQMAAHLGAENPVIFRQDAHPAIDLCDQIGKKKKTGFEKMPFLPSGAEASVS